MTTAIYDSLMSGAHWPKGHKTNWRYVKWEFRTSQGGGRYLFILARNRDPRQPERILDIMMLEKDVWDFPSGNAYLTDYLSDRRIRPR